MRTIPGKVHVSKRGRLNLPEVSLALGPPAEAEPGDGSLAVLYGHVWALVWDDLSDPLLLYRLDAGEWVEQTPPSPLPQLTSPARHVALAFDDSARAIIAWQGEQGVFVRQWNPLGGEYIVRGPFAGHDPVLVSDSLPRARIGGGDVVLYHLTADRSEIVGRLERDEYAVAYEVATLGRTDLYLDQLVRVPYRVRLELATDEVADPTLDRDAQDLERVRLESDLYPIPVSAAGVVTVDARGVYVATTEDGEPVEDAGAVTVDARGVYVATTEDGEPVEDAGAVTVDARGVYVASIHAGEPVEDTGLVTVDARGVYEHTTYDAEPVEDAAALTITARGEYHQT